MNKKKKSSNEGVFEKRQACHYRDFLAVSRKHSGRIVSIITKEIVKDLSSRTALVVYLLLYELSEKPPAQNHAVTISHQTIAKYINTSARTVARALNHLKAIGYIVVRRRVGKDKGYLANQIEVRLPRRLAQKLLKNDALL